MSQLCKSWANSKMYFATTSAIRKTYLFTRRALPFALPGVLLLVSIRAAGQTPVKKEWKRPYQVKSYVPEAGFVPDSATAVRIAEAVWLPIYGNSIEQEKPFRVQLRKDGIWAVAGTLHYEEGWKGGVAYI